MRIYTVLIALLVMITVATSISILSPLSAMSETSLDSDNNSLNIDRTGETTLAATPHALSPFLTFKDNVLYITWAEIDSKGVSNIYVKHKDGEKWVLDGGPLNQDATGHAASPTLTSSNSNLYAAWSEVNAKHVSHVFIKELEGDKWVQKWGSLNINSAYNASSPVLAVNNSSLNIAWTELNSSGVSLLHVKEWNGNSWRTLGDSLNKNTNRHALTPSMAVGRDGIYLAWAEYDDQSIARIYVNHWNGESWEPLGESVNIDPDRHAFSPSLSLAGSSPYISWMEYNEDGISQIYVKRWDGKGWVQIGKSLNINSSMQASVPTLYMKSDTPFVAWTEIGGTGTPNVYVKEWKRHSWLQAEKSLNIYPGMAASAPFIAVKDNSVYVAFTETDERGFSKLYVKELNESDIRLETKGSNENNQNSSPPSQSVKKKDKRIFFTSMPKDPKVKELPPPLAFKNLPRTSMGEINWMAGIRGGIVKPFDSTDPESKPPLSLNLDILLPLKKELGIPEVVFPHLSHSMWLDCRNCHPSIFIPKRGANPITMHRILEGEYCARCHGVVAFRIYDCFRCHSASP